MVHALINKKYLILYLNVFIIGFKMWNIQATSNFFSVPHSEAFWK